MSILRTCEIFRDATQVIIGIESIESLHGKTRSLYYLQGKIEPVAVVVSSPGAVYALDMEAKPISLGRLREAIPELDVLIASSVVA